MKKQREIVQVIDYGGTTGGSFIPALCTLAGAVRERGDRFCVLATPVAESTWPDELRSCGADVRFVSGERQCAEVLRAMQADVVHSHFTRYDIAAASTGARVFWHVHSFREQRSTLAELRARIKYRLLSRNVHAWICVSKGVQREILARGAAHSRTHVVHNGIDVDRFRPASPEQRREARLQLGIDDGDSVLLFFDRTPIKGGTTLREALADLPGHRLLVTGGARADWEAFAQRYDVTISPRLADPRSLYWAADALAMPSHGEGFSYVLAEAAACGLPIAASDIAPVREILGGVDDVFPAPVGDPRELAHAIARALGCKRLYAGRERIVQSFSVERWAGDLLHLYDA